MIKISLFEANNLVLTLHMVASHHTKLLENFIYVNDIFENFIPILEAKKFQYNIANFMLSTLLIYITYIKLSCTKTKTKKIRHSIIVCFTGKAKLYLKIISFR